MLTKLNHLPEKHGMTSRLRVQHKATRQDQRTQNRRLVLQCVVSEGPISRANIARTTGLTAATISDLVADLESDGLVRELGTAPSALGKPPTLYGLNAPARNIVTVDLSDGGIAGSVLDLAGVSSFESERSPVSLRGEHGVDRLIAMIDTLVDRSSAPVLGIGIATPGVIDESGTVVEASFFDWHDLPLATLLNDRYDVPVYVINNSRAAALAEYSYGDHEAENLLVVKIGNGVGAGVLLDGRIHGGEDSAAGEIGHVVVDPAGDQCVCGNSGCLETVASAPQLIERVSHIVDLGDGTLATKLEAVDRAVADGLPGALEAVEEAAENLGRVLATTVAILDIHKVVVTGVVSRLGDRFIDRLRSEIEKGLLSALASKLELSFGHTGDQSARMGAAALVMSRELGVV